MSIKNQQGAAIIIALFVMSLVAMVAVAMLERLQIDMHRTVLLSNEMHAKAYAQGSLVFAMDQLNQDILKKQNNHLVDSTPIILPDQIIEGVTIQTQIEDAEGRFNLNNLTDPSYQEAFSRLIRAVNPALEVAQAKLLTQYVVEWITAASTYDFDYLMLNPPYRVPHRLMQSVSELRLVKGFDSRLYQALLPYIIALPEITKININNAKAPVLMSLSETLTYIAANAIILQRTKMPYISTAQFLQNDVVKNNAITEGKISTQSNFFLVKSGVKVDQQELIVYTLLKRIQKNKQPNELVLWQSRGTL